MSKVKGQGHLGMEVDTQCLLLGYRPTRDSYRLAMLGKTVAVMISIQNQNQQWRFDFNICNLTLTDFESKSF